MANDTVTLPPQVADKLPSDYEPRSVDAPAQTYEGVPTSTFWAFSDFSAQGQFVQNIPLDENGVYVNAASQIAVSITELDLSGQPIVGDAVMLVFNVAPNNDSTVTVRGEVQWNEALPVRLNMVILN